MILHRLPGPALDLVEVKAGDVIYISGAAGAVGNVARQLAKLRRCKVIGSTGSMEKVKFLREECGLPPTIIKVTISDVI